MAAINRVNGANQLRQFCSAVVRGDVAVFVSEQHLARFPAHTGGPQAAAKGVLEIMHPVWSKNTSARLQGSLRRF
jgi:hypothetical protein